MARQAVIFAALLWLVALIAMLDYGYDRAGTVRNSKEWPTMDNRLFSEQIAAAVQLLGAEGAASCMARALICLAHEADNDLQFKAELGRVSIERISIPNSKKH